MVAWDFRACFQFVFVTLICRYCVLVESENTRNFANEINAEQSTSTTNSSFILFDTRAPSSNWQMIETGGDGKYIYGIIQDEAKINEPYSFSLFMSTDYGATWQSTPVANVQTDTAMYYLYVDEDTGCIIVGGVC